MHRLAVTVLTAVSLSGAGLTGCGSQKAATSIAPQLTATAVATGAPPISGSTSPEPQPAAAKSRPAVSQMATGKHDRVGEHCSGRYNARYTGEGLTCITGRLQNRHR